MEKAKKTPSNSNTFQHLLGVGAKNEGSIPGVKETGCKCLILAPRRSLTRTNCYMLVRSKTLVVRVKTLAMRVQ